MNSSTESSASSGGSQEWSVSIDQQGRGGTVTYREAGDSIPMSWEFGGSDVVAIIYFENESAWRQRYPWAAGRRGEILRRVADEVIRQRAPGSQAEIDERSGWINLRQISAPPVSPRDQHLAFRARKAKLMMILAATVLILAVGAIGFKSLFSVQDSTGTPLGLSIRTP